MVINLKKQRKTRKHHENQIHQENHKPTEQAIYGKF